MRTDHDPAIFYNPKTRSFEALDGVWEAENIDGEMLGQDRIYDLIRANASLSAKGILNILMEWICFTDLQKEENLKIMLLSWSIK